MGLQRSIKSTIGWCFSLGRRFLSVTPGVTVAVQLANLLAQALLILAFFLPLKVVILLGSDVVPGYFPSYLKAFDRDKVIVMVSAMALICYFFYGILEFFVAYLSKLGGGRLIKRAAKLNIFENQQDLAANAYSKFMRALSAGVFSFVAFAGLLFFYPLMTFVVFIYLIFSVSVVVVLFGSWGRFRALLEKHYGVIVGALASFGFLLAFFCMVADFLFWDPPAVFSALIALLLMRQGLQRLCGMIQDVTSLRSQFRQINALFFHHHQLVADSGGDAVHGFFEEAARKAWMNKVMEGIGIADGKVEASAWHQTGVADIYAFEAECRVSDGQKNLLFKVFGEHSFSLAEQELLIIKRSPQLPVPKFIGSSRVGKFPCHVFELDFDRKLVRRQIGPGVIDVAFQLLAIEPARDLVSQFSRSRPYLEQRLSREMLAGLRIAASDSQVKMVEIFSEKFEIMIGVLAGLPRQIISLDTTSDTLLISAAGKFRVSHWASWRMEPVGSNWPVGEREKLELAIGCARSSRPSLAAVPPEAIVLAAYSYAFERHCHRKNYVAAIELLSGILGCLESINPEAK